MSVRPGGRGFALVRHAGRMEGNGVRVHGDRWRLMERVVSARRAVRTLVVALPLAACFGCQPPTLVPVETHPARPVLGSDADTNDPRAYAIFAERHIGSAPDSAAAAFWWAARLDPWWAEPVYGRAVALLASRNYSLQARVRGRHPAPERDALVWATVDSLVVRASSLDPFFVHSLDYVLTGQMPTFMAERLPDPVDGGLVAFENTDYRLAVQLLGKALAKHPEKVDVRYIRAQAFYHLKQYDSSAAELAHLLDTLSARDTSRKILAPYRSKEMLYFALGTVQAARNDTPGARAAYEQALVENLGFTMARVRLAGLALAQTDTAGALRELDAALLANPDDPALQYYYGSLLWSVGRTRSAIDHLLRAVGLDDDFAAPHALLGRIAEAIGEREEAADEYAIYLQHAAAYLPERNWVAARLKVLRPAP